MCMRTAGRPAVIKRGLPGRARAAIGQAGGPRFFVNIGKERRYDEEGWGDRASAGGHQRYAPWPLAHTRSHSHTQTHTRTRTWMHTQANVWAHWCSPPWRSHGGPSRSREQAVFSQLDARRGPAKAVMQLPAGPWLGVNHGAWQMPSSPGACGHGPMTAPVSSQTVTQLAGARRDKCSSLDAASPTGSSARREDTCRTQQRRAATVG